MPKPPAATQVHPNLWHFSALVWGTSNLLLSLFAMPISFNPTGIRMQLGLTAVHFAGVFYLWRLARRGNPERLLHVTLVTLFFIYLVPLCMLIAPVIVLAAYALPSPAWQAVIAIFLCMAGMLASLRILATSRSKDTGLRFESFLADRLKGNVIAADSLSALLTRVGRHPVEPTRIDAWTMMAAIAVGTPILSADIAFDKASSSLAFSALLTTPMAMHAVSRMATHTYLWIVRLARYERAAGIKINVNFRNNL